MSVEIKKEKDEFTPPEPIQVNGDKKLWIIDGYRVWAKTYAEAVQLAIMIDGF